MSSFINTWIWLFQSALYFNDIVFEFFNLLFDFQIGRLKQIYIAF